MHIDPRLTFLLTVLLLLLSIMAYSFILIKRQTRHFRQWDIIAQKMRFHKTTKNDNVREYHGSIYGLSARMGCSSYNKKKDVYQQGAARWRVKLPAEVPLNFELQQEGLLAKVSKLGGAQDITTGDAAFDAAFILKALDPDEVRSYFAPEHRRAALLDLRRQEPDLALYVVDGELTCALGGLVTAERLEQVMELVARRVYEHLYGATPDER